MASKKTAILAALAILAILAIFKGHLNDDIEVTGFAIRNAPTATSPADRVTEEQIRANDEAVLIKIPNATIGRLESTSSMSPLLNNRSNAIMVSPQKPDDVREGDIIVYNSKEAAGLVVHRIVEIGRDSEGWFATAKGDNSNAKDPEKVRFSEIKYVIVGIIY